MNKTTVWSAFFILLSPHLTLADQLKSGLQPGDIATPFDVREVTGPNKGQTLCYR